MNSLSRKAFRLSGTMTSSTPGSPPPSGPSPPSAGPRTPQNPFALSLSKGRPCLRATKQERTVLRQAQHERIWGAGNNPSSRATTPPDRKSVVKGKRVSVREELGGRRIQKKKK